MLGGSRECGYDSLMEGVAASTSGHQSTLYRRWKTKPQFVAAALRANSCPRFSGIDAGTLAGDLRAMAQAAGNWSGRDSQLHQALGHAVFQDKELQEALRDALVEPEVGAVKEILARGVARGEVAADHPALEFIPAQLFGVVRVRPVLEGRNADAAYLTQFVEAVVIPALGLTWSFRSPSAG